MLNITQLFPLKAIKINILVKKLQNKAIPKVPQVLKQWLTPSVYK